VVIATDGSTSAVRAVEVALDLAATFDAAVHALCVVDEREVTGTPEDVREEMRAAMRESADEALSSISDRTERSVTTSVCEGDPAGEICRYVAEQDADVVAMGTRGRHGDHGFVLGSVAESVVQRCERPVLTVRQLEGDSDATGAA